MQISRFSKSFLILIVGLILLSSLFVLRRPILAYKDPWSGSFFGEGGVEVHDSVVPHHGVNGAVIMGKLGNATAKAALGRATWKLLHTMTLRYPDHPTMDERLALASYFHLSARLYPCGECASEFQSLLEKYPPQTSSRRAASLWLCHLHNQVNERLAKSQFDCANLDGIYDCGCGDEPLATDTKSASDEVTGIDLIRGGR